MVGFLLAIFGTVIFGVCLFGNGGSEAVLFGLMMAVPGAIWFWWELTGGPGARKNHLEKNIEVKSNEYAVLNNRVANNAIALYVSANRDYNIQEHPAELVYTSATVGGITTGGFHINEAYRTGRGKIRVRAVTDIEPMDNGKNRIVVTELPYLVNKARLIEKIAELHKEKRIDGITDLRDESDREGMRVVIELRRDVNPSVVLNLLYKHTQLQDTFGVINLALVNGEPKVLNLYELYNFIFRFRERIRKTVQLKFIIKKRKKQNDKKNLNFKI